MLKFEKYPHEIPLAEELSAFPKISLSLQQVPPHN